MVFFLQYSQILLSRWVIFFLTHLRLKSYLIYYPKKKKESISSNHRLNARSMFRESESAFLMRSSDNIHRGCLELKAYQSFRMKERHSLNGMHGPNHPQQKKKKKMRCYIGFIPLLDNLNLSKLYLRLTHLLKGAKSI